MSHHTYAYVYIYLNTYTRAVYTYTRAVHTYTRIVHTYTCEPEYLCIRNNKGGGGEKLCCHGSMILKGK